MQLRTFIAPDMRQAIAAMRTELGDDAMIVATESLKDGSVLLRAGLECGDVAPTPGEESDQSESSTAAEPGIAPFDLRFRDSMVARLRGEPAKTTRNVRNFDRDTLISILREQRTPGALTAELADEAERSGIPDLTLALASALDKFTQAGAAGFQPGRPIVLIGPPGCGKTAVAAKLAAQSILDGHTVTLAATDLTTAGQAARLESFAASLDVPFIGAGTRDNLLDAIKETRESESLLIVDSTSFDPRQDIPAEVLSLLSIGTLDIIGIVSAAWDAEEIGGIADALAKLGATRIIATGLDLVHRKGALIQVACSGLKLLHVTGSPYLDDGLDQLTPLALARAVIAAADFPLQKVA